MNNLTNFCPITELFEKKKITKWVDSLKDEISAFYVGKKIYVYSSICPHNGGEFNLNIKKKELKCLWHGWKFNVETGKSITNFKDYKKNSIIHKMLLQKEKAIGCFPFEGRLKRYNFKIENEFLKVVTYEDS